MPPKTDAHQRGSELGKAWNENFERNTEGLTEAQIEAYEEAVSELDAPLPKPEEVIDMAKTSKKSGKPNNGAVSEKQEEKPKKEVKVVPITRHLKVQLTDSEVAERADQAAHKWAAIKSEEADLKATSQVYKARIAEKSAQLDTLQQEVRDHCTYRDVDCHEVHDFEGKIVKIIRLDTRVEIERRDMTRAELQLPLPRPRAPEKDGTETMSCHGKPSPEAVRKLKESAVERLNDDGDLTASELRARARKQEALHGAVEEAEGEQIEDDSDEDPDDDGIIDA